ncbi:MAG: RNA 2',3'-cyclic phosphodiesterase [Anaerolineae bacterium]
MAIELSPELKQTLSSIQEALRAQLHDGSVGWVRPEGVHLTLKFLGEVARDRIPEIGLEIEAAARDADRFKVFLQDLGGFPSVRSPRVVWVGVREPTGTLAQIQKRIETELESAGFPRENRPFSPHLTIGRVRGQATEPRRRLGRVLEASALAPEGEMEIEKISLMRSQLHPSGARYTQLAEAKLRSP